MGLVVSQTSPVGSQTCPLGISMVRGSPMGPLGFPNESRRAFSFEGKVNAQRNWAYSLGTSVIRHVSVCGQFGWVGGGARPVAIQWRLFKGAHWWLLEIQLYSPVCPHSLLLPTLHQLLTSSSSSHWQWQRHTQRQIRRLDCPSTLLATLQRSLASSSYFSSSLMWLQYIYFSDVGDYII